MSEGTCRAALPAPADASGALIVRDDGCYLLQLRDNTPGIFFPAHWGLFGGAIDAGETPDMALRRELREELALEAPSLTYFTKLTFDFAPHGFGTVARVFFEVPLGNGALRGLHLGEGSAMRWFAGEALLRDERVTPYDAFAIWMHLARR